MKSRANLISTLDKLREASNIPLIMKKLVDVPSETMVDLSINIVHLFARGREDEVFFFAETIYAIGNAISRVAKLPKNSGDAARIGGFVVYVFEVAGILKLELQNGRKRHATYAMVVTDHDALSKLWDALPSSKTLKMPLSSPQPAWQTCFAPDSDEKMIKTNSKSVLSITAETHPMVFRSVNRPQEIGWRVNKKVLAVASWAFKEKQDAFTEIWVLADREARASKVRETKTVISMANKLKSNVFYHRYYLDFRGRQYPATAYLHEQGSDLASALLLREYGKPLGEIGYFWLRVCIASNWGGDSGRSDGVKTDKLPLSERAAWTDANEGLILSYVTNPRESTGWMRADKPWKFLADCIELFNLRAWQRDHAMQIRTRQVGRYDYASNREGFIDGL